ncbi:MATE family efflux transporter [Halosquirtibacter xylanolyticus]|uniref:MATE family efflux transporter n=1 Tax=Halosquirtibacter xylanolyticus TaxID=3374599 RepID=UPI003749AB9B|nr:MATE family efflux transporter [Prolixibacteraceae bacterium]
MILKQQKYSQGLRSLMTLAIPMVGSQLLQLTYNFIDMIWVGKLGGDAVAAVGTAGFFLNLGWALASIITVGVNVKLSQSIGAKKELESKVIAKSGLLGMVFLALLFSVLMGSNTDYWISLFQMDNQWVNEASSNYLFLGSWGAIITFLNLLFISILNSYKQTKRAFKINSIGFILNIVLDPILIFLLDLGVQGAIIATLISKAVTLYFLAIEVYRKSYIRVSINNDGIRCLREIVRLGFPTSVQRIIFGLIYIVMGKFIATFGTDAIAIQKIGIQIESITFTLVAGISQASTIIVGQLYGAGKYNEIKQTYRQALLLSGSAGVILTLTFLLIPEYLIRLFVDSPEIIKGGAWYLRIIGVSQVFMTSEMIGMGTLNGLGMTVLPPINSILLTSIRIPIAYFLAFSTSLGLTGIWWSISATSILKGIVLTVMVLIVFHKRKGYNGTVVKEYK